MKRKKFDPEKNHVWEFERKVKEEAPKLPEPTYSFSVGEEVSYGAWEKCVVSRVECDGKIYEIIKNDVEKGWVTWVEIRPLENINSSLIKNGDLWLSYSQRALSDIFSKKYKFGLDMEPEYQRDYVWELGDEEMLIDSIFKNIDIGRFLFVKLPYADNSPSYEILDGKQRINALARFFENRFSYKGYFYNDLSKGDKSHFRNYNISIAEMGEKTTLEQKLRIFIAVNTHGRVMSRENLEKVEKMLQRLKK